MRVARTHLTRNDAARERTKHYLNDGMCFSHKAMFIDR
jgi:hypothetical protein